MEWVGGRPYIYKSGVCGAQAMPSLNWPVRGYLVRLEQPATSTAPRPLGVQFVPPTSHHSHRPANPTRPLYSAMPRPAGLF